MKTTDFINESFVEDAAEAHQDHEVQMARSDCYNAAKYAIELHKLLKNISEQQGLDGWVSEKITLANDYLRTVTEYLRYEQQSGSSSDMPDFDVRSATQTLDSVLGESATSNLQENAFTWYLKAHGRLLTPPTSETPYQFKSKEEAVAFAKQKYKTNWQNIVPTTYNVANSLADQPDSGWDEKQLNVQHEDEEPQQKRQPAVVKTNKPIGTRVADIGPGGKEYNVKTNKAWDDQHKEVDEERTVTRDETGKIIAWRDESDWRRVDKDKDGRGKVANLSDKARRETEKLQKDQGVDEGKADPVGSWVVYGGGKVKRFKTRDGAKAYAEKTGGKVASSEFYADNIQGKQDVAEGLGKSIKRAAQGWGGAQDKPADIVKRNKAHDIDTAKRLRTGMDDASDHTPQGLQKRVLDRKLKGVAEDMSRAAKGHEKYGKEGMQALAKAGREGASEKTLDAIRDKHDKYDEDLSEEAKKGLYYYVNKRKKAGTSRDADHPKAPRPQDWKNAAKTAKKESVAETTSSGSVASSMGGGNGFANGGPGTIARPKMKKKQ